VKYQILINNIDHPGVFRSGRSLSKNKDVFCHQFTIYERNIFFFKKDGWLYLYVFVSIA